MRFRLCICPTHCRSLRGEEFDLHGPALPQTPAKLQIYQWNSARLGNRRKVWIYTTGESQDPASRPLAILLDGQFWAQQMPVWQPLMQLTQEGTLPQAVYVLIDVIDTQTRSRELTCNADFWLAVQEELLPAVATLAPHSSRCEQNSGGGAELSAGFPRCTPVYTGRSASVWYSVSRALSGGRDVINRSRMKILTRRICYCVR